MEPDDALLGAAIDGYVLTERLGEGGMGVVYRAEPEGGGEAIAVKVLHPQLTGQADVFERFEREARIGMQLDHPQIVRTIDIGSVELAGVTSRYLSMELVEGQTLRRLLDELGRVPEALCLHIAAEIAGALTAIHAAGIVHRDLKPENVLITPADEIKLMDLGVARLMDEAVRLSRTGQFVGSVLYAAPEQLEARARVDGALDLWSLGVLLYELSTGINPFAADTLHGVIQRILGHEPAPPSQHADALSPFFDRLVLAMLVKSRAERFPSAIALVEVLRDGMGSPWWKTQTDADTALELAEQTRLKVARLTACHGRDAELDLLLERFARAQTEGAQGVLIEGEAGVGKTRLADAMLERLAAGTPQPLVLAGAPAPGGAATPHGALAAALRSGLPEHGMEDALRAHLGKAAALLPAFAALLRGEPPPDGASSLTPGALQGLFAQVLRSLATQQPVVVVVDDMHRAPAGARALTAGLLTTLGESPVVIVLLARDGIPPEWTAELVETGRLAHVALGRLDTSGVRAILDELFAGDLGVDDLIDPLFERTGGNPRFVFGALERLGEQGVVDRTPRGPWLVTRGAHATTGLSLPDDERAAITLRLADLADAERELLEVAAVIGTHFNPDVVAEVLEEKRLVVLRRLSRLERRGRLVRADGRSFQFDHALLAETVYAAMPDLEREATHAAIADVYLRLLDETGGGVEAAGSEDGVAACRHLVAGARASEALPLLLHAKQFLVATFRREEAMALLDSALAVPQLLEGGERSAYLYERARILGALGRVQDAVDTLRESMAAAPESTSARARALRSLAWHSYTLRELDEARLQAEEARQLSIEGGFVSTLGAAERLLGLIASREGRFRAAQRRLRVARDIAKDLKNDGLMMNALLNLGTAVALQDARPEAAEHFKAALEIARRAGEKQVEQAALGNLAYLSYLHGDLDSSVAHNRASIEIAVQIGHRGGQATGHGNLGWILAEQGHYAEAERHTRRQIALAEETGQLDSLLNGLERTAMIRLRLGDVVQAAELIHRRARAATEQPPHAVATIELEGQLAKAQQDYESALTHFARSVKLCRENDLRPQLAKALTEAAVVLVWLERVDEMTPLIQEAQDVGRAVSNPRTVVLADCLAVHTGARDPAEALAVLDAQVGVLGANDQIECLWILWRKSRDPALVARAWALIEAHTVEGQPGRTPRDREIESAASG